MKPEVVSELRNLVREVVREAVASRPQPGTVVERIAIASDADLAAFVTRIIQPATTEAIKCGKLKFTLAQTAPVAAASPTSGMLEGVVTEQKIDRLGKSGTVVLAPGAVLTPLARDKARQLGLKIERRR